MGIRTIKVTAYTCERCLHEWLPRDATAEDQDLPKVCPKCKSPYWNTPRREGNPVRNSTVQKKPTKPRKLK